MIERYRADGVEPTEIVAIRSVVPMPRNNVERRMIARACPQISAELCDDLAVLVAVFEPCNRRFEVARIRKTVSTDRSEIGKTKMLSVIFANITAGPGRRHHP